MAKIFKSQMVKVRNSTTKEFESLLTFKGDKGDNGLTPYIGGNGNWWIGDTDTGITAGRTDGESGKDGKSAYQYAQDGGYTGTEEEFTQELAMISELFVDTDKIKDDLDDTVERLEKLEYGTLEISSFTASPSQAEIGSTQNVILSWNTNKTPKSLTLDGVDVLGNTSINKSSISSNTSWSLKAVGMNNETTKTAKITFLPKLYYGASAIPSEINSEFLLGLLSSLSGTKAKSFNTDASDEQYIWFALPTRYGAASFKVGGFDGGFSLINTIQHTNSSGYTENYDVYRSDNAGLGITTVTVS